MRGTTALTTADKKEASMKQTASMIATRTPGSYKIGDVTVSGDVRSKKWEAEVKTIIAKATGKWRVTDRLNDT